MSSVGASSNPPDFEQSSAVFEKELEKAATDGLKALDTKSATGKTIEVKCRFSPTGPEYKVTIGFENDVSQAQLENAANQKSLVPTIMKMLAVAKMYKLGEPKEETTQINLTVDKQGKETLERTIKNDDQGKVVNTPQKEAVLGKRTYKTPFEALKEKVGRTISKRSRADYNARVTTAYTAYRIFGKYQGTAKVQQPIMDYKDFVKDLKHGGPTPQPAPSTPLPVGSGAGASQAAPATPPSASASPQSPSPSGNAGPTVVLTPSSSSPLPDAAKQTSSAASSSKTVSSVSTMDDAKRIFASAPEVGKGERCSKEVTEVYKFLRATFEKTSDAKEKSLIASMVSEGFVQGKWSYGKNPGAAAVWQEKSQNVTSPKAPVDSHAANAKSPSVTKTTVSAVDPNPADTTINVTRSKVRIVDPNAKGG